MTKYILPLLFAAAGFGQTIPNAVPPPAAQVQFVDANGVPLAGGKLYTYAAGTTTPQASYTDSSAGTPNTNPIILDAGGRAQLWIGPNAYKLVLQDANGVQQWTEDNLVDTTLNFVNYVKTAGTATLISYTPPNGQPQTTVAAELTLLTTHPYIDLKINCGAKGDGTTNDYTAITTCLASNSIVYAPPGTYCTQTPLIIPNKTQLLGAGRGDSGGPNTVFKACSGFPINSAVISLCSTPGPCSGVQAENLTIDCNHIAGCTAAYNAYAQEQSWYRRVLAINYKAYGFWLDVGTNSTSAAQNSGPYEDLEALPGADAVATTVCFDALRVPNFRGVRGITCNASSYSVIPTAAIVIDGSSPARVSDAHVEHSTNAVQIGSAANGTSDVVVENLSTGPDVANAVNLYSAAVQNVTVIGVQSSAGNVILDNCNSITLPATTGSGFYATGYGSCGHQTVLTTRQDIPLKLQTALTVLKNENIAGTGSFSDDGKICLGPGLPFCAYVHESNNSGEPGAVLKTDNLGALIQNSQVSGGAPGGGLHLLGNGFSTDAAFAEVGAGLTSDGGTYTARATSAAFVQFTDGGIGFYSNTGLTPGTTFTPTLRFQWLTSTGNLQVQSGGAFAFNGNTGFTGTKTAGSCTIVFQAGIATNVTGC